MSPLHVRTCLAALTLALAAASGAGAQSGSLSDASELTNSANHLFQRGLYGQADPLYRRALAIRQTLLTPDKALPIATSLWLLARNQWELGGAAEASALDQQALDIRERLLGSHTVVVGQSAFALARDDVALYRFNDAETMYKQALAIAEQFARTEPALLSDSLQSLAELYRRLGRLTDAVPLYQRARAIEVGAYGANSQQIAYNDEDVALLLGDEGRFAESEALFKEALGILESTLGTDHPEIANLIDNLAGVERNQGRDRDAEPLLERALAIRQHAFGPASLKVALALNDLGRDYRVLGRLGDAESLLQQAVTIDRASHGAQSGPLGVALESLGEVYGIEGKHALADAAYQEALAIRQKLWGERDLGVAMTLTRYASELTRQRRDVEAIVLLDRAIADYDQAGRPDNPDRARAYGQLADTLADEGRLAEAVRASDTATEILRRNFADQTAQGAAEDISLQHSYNFILVRAIRYHYLLASGQPAKTALVDAAVVDSTFALTQLTAASTTGEAVAGMAARFAAGTDALGTLVRQREDLAERVQQLDSALTADAALPLPRRDVSAEAAMRSQLVALRSQLGSQDRTLAALFPTYTELVEPEPLTIGAVQKLLGGDEALLAYEPANEETFLWVVRPRAATLFRLPINNIALRAEIRALRDRLDPERNPNLLPFPATRSYQLFEKLLAPALPALAGVHALLVVPGGGLLSSLPLSVLVTRAPATDPVTPADHRAIAWLARDFAISVLPTVNSLRALRRFTETKHADQPFLGVGDPVLDGAPGNARGIDVATLFRGAGGNVDAIRKLPPLPETADELRSIARTLEAPDSDLLLQQRATEPVLRSEPLDQFRVIEFATHALVAGDFPGLAEPTLVLTPPPVATPQDDGLLTASKIATLKLNADWVVLSACNTAAGDGTPGASGFSGLAKAFFYAGARSLLVSNWAIPSQPTVRLTTGAFAELARDPQIGRAEALRRAMIAMLDPANPPEFAHPAAWAPFSLVGEGGSGR